MLISAYWESVLTISTILAIAGIGLQITMATGQFSIMHGALMGLGGYVAGIAAKSFELPLPVTMVAAGLTAAAVGVGVSIALARLSGLMLGLVTLALGVMLEIIANTFFPGGPAGYTQVPIQTRLPVAVLVLAVILVALSLLKTSRLGVAVAAVGSDPMVAASLGISPRRVKAWGFGAGGLVAGVAGALAVQFLGVVEPGDLGFVREIELLTFVILGGVATPWGAVVGAFALTTGQEVLRVATLDRGWILGVLLATAMVLRPEGVLRRLPIRWRRNEKQQVPQG